MLLLRRAFAELVKQFELLTEDSDLLRAQYREFTHQVPLLYLVLSCNAVLTSLIFSPVAGFWLCSVAALGLSATAAVRGIQWSRRRGGNFTDAEVRRHIQTTGRLAILLSIGYMAWGMILYPLGDPAAKSQLLFCLGLTHTCTVFCLMPLRSAALWAATTSTALFTAFCFVAEPGALVPQALMLALLSAAMLFVLYRQNRTFGDLISSQRELRQRHLVTEKLSEENKLIAFTDALSRLPNRRALLARLEELGGQQRPAPDLLAVVFIDLDGFKLVNDSYGHEVGDLLIKTASAELEAIRPDDATLVRIGGDEFALLAEGNDAGRRAEQFARGALRALTLPMMLQGKQVKIGASIGYASDDTGDVKPLELLRRADTAMYSVKATGRGGTQAYDPGLDAERARRRKVGQEIAGGLARCEFDVVYQPIIDARVLSVSGVEALVRWPGRPEGPLSPDEFIEIAESNGMIQALGMFVLERACRDTAGISGLRLSVNVSPAQLSHPEFERQVTDILALTGFPPERLQLEITERNLIEHPERARQSIAALQQAGVTFALDDFGTGFTSLAYLRSYGFTCVKIDRSLIKQLETDPKAVYLISGLIQMSKGLDLKVVAEGVETAQLARMLRTSGCNELQGYYYGRPGELSAIFSAASPKASVRNTA